MTTTKAKATTMTDLSPEERIRRLQERRQEASTGRGGKGRSKRTPPARASRVAVLGVSTTIMLGMMTGMGWNTALQASVMAAPQAAASTPSSLTFIADPAPSGVLDQTRSQLGAAPAPTTVIPTRQILSITRSGGSR